MATSRRWLKAGLVFGVMLIGAAFAWTAFIRWLNPPPEDPESFLNGHRAELAEIASLVDSGELARPDELIDAYYGPELPESLRHLSATGKVTILEDGSFFLPRWTGIPDDAGGYWHSPSSPQGHDMYGLVCDEPLSLGGAWWSCGLVEDGPG